LLCAADPALSPVVKKTTAPVMNATDKDSDQAQLLEQLNISTSRAKVLHFLAVARIRKNELVEQYPMLKQLVAVTDSEGGTTPNPNVLRPLLQASDGDDTSGAVGTIDVRRLMPLLGWDSRVDMVTMERLPGFEIGNEEAGREGRRGRRGCCGKNTFGGCQSFEKRSRGRGGGRTFCVVVGKDS
jgi:hypothetical protein